VFLPWKDDNPARRTAWVTLALIAANVGVFVWELASGPAAAFDRYGLIPSRLLAGQGLATLATSAFLHAGVLHLASNVLFLWIFGHNVEAVLGPLRFAVLYAGAALGAHAAQVVAAPTSAVPTVGASGAIAGVLAAYVLRFPAARIHTFVYLIFIFGNFRIPAAVVIGVWFLAQVLGSLTTLGSVEVGGVAWFEHLGGFVTGGVLFPLLAGRSGRRVSRW
jgi:membrane associated rhomboid family serine protease